jgi:protein Mpv17
MTSRLKHFMENSPILSNSLLCLKLFIAGDLCAQYSENRYLQDGDGSAWDLLDTKRTAQCAVYGATVTGPILATWYPFMEQVCIKYKVAARYGPWGAPILKVLADEFLMDPPCLVSFFFWMNLCEGGDMATLQNKLQTQFLPSWMASLAVWPVVLLGTFRFAPLYAQAPIISIFCIGWDGFLSYRNTLSNANSTHKIGTGRNNMKNNGGSTTGPTMINY